MSLQPNGRASGESSGPRRRVQRHRRRNRRDRQEPYTQRRDTRHTNGQQAAITNGSTTDVHETVPEPDAHEEASVASINLDEQATAEDRNGHQNRNNGAGNPQHMATTASLSSSAITTAQVMYDQQVQAADSFQSAALYAWSTAPISQDAWTPLGGARIDGPGKN
ncbi:hypothetical protein PFICI_08400 [Pestalotiopsis fici W106-1]|uniref:Uncharacterized protein n=1 Tax=Pestalotiopsis fici (strain W106-1 / CGMCC3.15140) TaxID=1229662 RepID=W3X6R1_PESFW|nr:uncharacterized protein PFICI_08400 [Pestalotiopsis fici W106-1]ETS80871.1 hypothetical protein PFICI_08400 [Pestalotiopsis fici W106-1]